MLAELFGWRSVFFYLAVGGAIGLVAISDSVMWAGDNGGDALLFPAAGFVGAFVYWLIAGRLCGRRTEERPAAARTAVAAARPRAAYFVCVRISWAAKAPSTWQTASRGCARRAASA